MAKDLHRLLSILGTPPINPVLFVIAKLALVSVVAIPAIQWLGPPIHKPVPGLLPLAAVLVVLALLLFGVASRDLGQSLKVGLPTEDTALKTSGLYRFSRNPIYLAMFLFCLASCLYCPHPAVLVSAVVAVILHHRIALAEEAFLEQRFGEAWRSYKAQVPRYLGLRRRG
jgi:protein-S-isoprenylcysteine O-methyltransferase Ste14